MTGIIAREPGRVNLIGDHTDYTGGFCFPIAIAQGVTVTGQRAGDRVRVRSETEPAVADLPLDIAEPAEVEPAWARYVAAVVAELRPAVGLDAEITTDLPQGVGLSSSAALENLDTSNGPDLFVYLSTNPPDGAEGQFDDDYVNQGRLQGNVGSSNYVVPAGTDLARYASVVLWCDRFDSAFGADPLF